MHKSRHIFVFPGLLAVLSCSPDPVSFSGKPHFWRPAATQETLSAWPSGDTTVYVCTVSYPEGYDWLRDSSGLREGCRIRLMANGKTCLTLETGAATGLGPDGDTHHLYGGHLLSEGDIDGCTLLLRDGQEMMRFRGREKLCGYLQADGTAYSLWRDRDGNGLTLRKNADVLLRREQGRPFGDFGDPATGSGGALSLSGGTVSFAYQMPAGGETGCFLCIGGSDFLLYKDRDIRFLDARLLEGKTWVLYCREDRKLMLSDGMTRYDMSYYGVLDWQEARMISREGIPGVLGTALAGRQKIPLYLLLTVNGTLWSGGTGTCIPIDGNLDYILCYDSGHHLALHAGMSRENASGGPVLWESGEEVIFVPGSCTAVLGNRVFMGISPRNRGRKPYLWSGRKLGEWGLNGYICAVEVRLSPPT